MTEIDEIARAERRLREAMLAGDVDTLDELLRPEMVLTNQAGIRLSKSDDLATHKSGLLRIARLDVRGEPLIRPLGESAVVCVTVDLEGAYDGQPFGGAFAYTRLWHRQHDGTWRVEAAHCSIFAEG